MEVDKVFDATPIAVQMLLHNPGRCYYVPIYQRPYTWDASHIERLFSDVAHGVGQLVENADAITFLGTIITIHDTNYATVDPKVVGEVPARVMTVIDGQQRLSTLLLLMCCLHEELVRDVRPLKESPDETDQWLVLKAQETAVALAKTYEDDQELGGARYYPRMIRALADQWSRKVAEARYASPVASAIHRYAEHTRSGTTTQFKIADLDSSVSSRMALMRRVIRNIIGGATVDDDIEMASASDLAASGNTGGLFQGAVPPHPLIDARMHGEEGEKFVALFRKLVFARYVLQRVVVTLVTAKSEDYAFDMFEALNTTGEPLTAIETFKPRMIRAEGQGQYESSKAFESMKVVEAYLDRFDKAPARQSATTDLLIPFALAETGWKLSKRLNEQRRYLSARFDEVADTEDSRAAFGQHLANTTMIVDALWTKSGSEPTIPHVTLDTTTRLCIGALRAANHHIVTALVARFYTRFRAGLVTNEDMLRLLRSVTAFFALWRGAFGSTHNIDTVHRRLLSSGDPDDQVAPIARRPGAKPREDDGLDESVAAICRFLRSSLVAEGIDTKTAWATRCAAIPIYSSSQPLTRLLLLAATHDTVQDVDEPGLPKAGQAGTLALLTFEAWSAAGTLTVEHVAPQSRTPAWADDLYTDEGVIDCLGNLTLVPGNENSGLSNLDWPTKRAAYRVLASKTTGEADAVRAEALAGGLMIPASIGLAAEYRPAVQYVADYPDEWTKTIVELRSKRLADIAWDRLCPWLE